MIDYCLRFPSEADAAMLFEDDMPKYMAVDVIGTIYKPTGKLLPSDSGEAVDEMAPVPGWHVNVRHSEAAPELESFQVFPATPVRVWA